MKKSINKYKIMCILLFFISCLVVNQTVYAGDSKAIDFSQADDFINKGKNSNIGISDLSGIGESFSTIGNVLTYIGAGILVGATGYMGILYLISTPEKQAKLKEQSIGLVVSAVVIFGAYFIWEILVKFLSETIG